MVMWCGRAENGSSLLVNHDRLTNTQRHRISGAEGVPQQRGRDDACVSARVLRASHVPNQARCGIRVVTDGQGQACMQSGRDVAGISWISRPVYRVFRSILQCLRGMQQGNPLCGQYWRTHCLLDAGISGHIWQKAVIRQSMRVLSFLCKRLASAICRVFLKNDTTSSVFLCIRGIVTKLLPSTDGFQRSCGSLSAA